MSAASLAVGVALVVMTLAPVAALAQPDTRAASIVEAQTAKAQQIKPYEPGKAERLAEQIKKTFFESPEGFYPWFASVYSGGGFTAGGGYRNFYGDNTFWNARGLYSVKAYKLAELITESRGLANDRVDLRVVGGFRDATQVAFYGVGPDTDADARTNFGMQQAYIAGAFRGRGPGPFFVDFSVAYENFSLGPGDGTSPSIEDVHTAETAPGLGDSPDFAHIAWIGGIDSRDPAPGYARRGGLYALAYDSYFDPDHTYTFDRLQGEIVQHVPILRENWVVSLHGAARVTLDEQYIVPYFLLPALGSGSTLRAYPSWRFRDRHSLLVSGEWRWIPNRRFLDVALFYDAGKVAGRFEDLNFKDLTHDAGVGVRVHGTRTTWLRIDVAKGSEGFNLVFSGSAPF